MLSKAQQYYYFELLKDLFNLRFRHLFGYMYILAAIVSHKVGAKQKCAKYLMASNRICYSSKSIALFKRYSLLDKEVLFPLVSSGVSIDEAASRSIVIRWPEYEGDQLASKGILLITFTRTFSYYLRAININNLTRHFNVVLEPSWSGYFDPDILCWALETKEPVFVEATELLDRILLNALATNLVPLSCGASDWVNYNSFCTNSAKKQYDSLYVANTSHVKRIIRYMKAVRAICKTSNPDYQGCLVCASWGGNQEAIKSLPRHFGIQNNLELRFSLNKKELNEVINASKVNILLSYKEGSNRSLFESMFADIPAICIAENIGVNKTYINEHTGLLISDSFLEEGLLYMKENWQKYRPRDWALMNISPEKTMEKLLSVIDAWVRQLDADKVYLKTNNPEVSYFDYPSIEFTDINKSLLKTFKGNGNEKDFDTVASKVMDCQQVFINRLPGL